MRALLIVNPVSGDAEDKREHIQAALAGAAWTVQVELTSEERSAADIARQALQDGIKIILVGGGDGTVSMVARELINTEGVLGIIPVGTFNNMARSLEIPADIEAACQIAKQHHVGMIDVGLANETHPFFEAAGAGLDAALFPLGEEIKGGSWGRWFQVLRLIFQYQAPKFRLTFNCTVAEALPPEQRRRYSARDLRSRSLLRRALFVVAANGPYYGSGFTVAPAAGMRDGKLTISLYRNFSKWQLLRHFLSISRGQRHYSPNIETFSATGVEIGCLREVPVHLDGVLFGNTPMTLNSQPGVLRVLIPQ